MTVIGKKNYLQIIKKATQGVYLDGGSSLGEILLPKKFVPKGFDIDDWLDVFIYYDSEDRMIATTKMPLAQVDEFAHLKVIDINKVGAFVDWGLEKDLLIPYSEQITSLTVGRSYTLYIYRDKHSKRITATTKIDQHLKDFNQQTFKIDEPVDIMIYRKNELGFSAIINHSHIGMLYDTEIFQNLHYGQTLKARIKKIRPDDKIDLSLNLPSKESYQELPQQILQFLRDNDGISFLTDKSTPQSIYAQYAVSKTNYKKALGKLYKEKKIMIDKKQISLTKEAAIAPVETQAPPQRSNKPESKTLPSKFNPWDHLNKKKK